MPGPNRTLADNDFVDTLDALIACIDERIERWKLANTALQEQARQTRAILAELGITREAALSAAAPVAVPVPLPVQAPRVSPVARVAEDDPARLEQLRYLEQRKAERETLLAQMRGGVDAS